jgi:hypothetical protein
MADAAAEPAPKPKARAKAAPKEDPGETFDISPFVEGEEVLGWQKISIDTEIKHGQIRPVAVAHRDELVEALLRNPPPQNLQPTTVYDQGALRPPPSPPSLSPHPSLLPSASLPPSHLAKKGATVSRHQQTGSPLSLPQPRAPTSS